MVIGIQTPAAKRLAQRGASPEYRERPRGGARMTPAVLAKDPIAPTHGRDERSPVLVVDDHPALRRGVSATLEGERGLGPIVVAGTAAEAVTIAEELELRVAVVDYHLPDEDGLSLCLRLSSGPTATIIYSAFADEFLVPMALIAGARGLLSKDADPELLCTAVSDLTRGENVLPKPSQAAMESAGSRLDPDDLPILGMLAHGTSPEEIAATLEIDVSWLAMRRWAMLERLRGGPTRRPQRPTGPR